MARFFSFTGRVLSRPWPMKLNGWITSANLIKAVPLAAMNVHRSLDACSDKISKLIKDIWGQELEHSKKAWEPATVNVSQSLTTILDRLTRSWRCPWRPSSIGKCHSCSTTRRRHWVIDNRNKSITFRMNSYSLPGWETLPTGRFKYSSPARRSSWLRSSRMRSLRLLHRLSTFRS